MTRWPLSREQSLSEPAPGEAAVEDVHDALWLGS